MDLCFMQRNLLQNTIAGKFALQDAYVKQNTSLTVCLFHEEQFTDISLDISILA